MSDLSVGVDPDKRDEYEIGGRISPRLLERLAAVEAARDLLADQLSESVDFRWRETYRARAAEARVELLEAALRDLLDNLGGHSHPLPYPRNNREG